MTPERGAEALRRLLCERREMWSKCYPDGDAEAEEECLALQEAIDAATAPKSAEASIKERIDGLTEELRFIRATAAVTRRDLDAARVALEKIWEVADRALDGPSDPDRDRETTAEQVRP